MKKIYLFSLILLLAISFGSCGGGGTSGTSSFGGDSIGSLFSKTTVVSGTVFLSGSVSASGKPSSAAGYKAAATGSQMDKVLAESGVKSAVLPPLINATIKLYNADRPDWVYPVAQVFTDANGTYKLDKLTNADLNLDKDGNPEYENDDEIPAGNYTIIATNDTTVSGGEQYVAVQAFVKRFEGVTEGNDLVVQDSDASPSVIFMLGLNPNSDGSFGGVDTVLPPNAGIQIVFNMAMARLSVIEAVKVYRGDASATPVSGSWKFTPDLLTATFYPENGLVSNATYTVKIAGGDNNASAAVNVFGKPLPSAVSAVFTADSEDDTTNPNAILYQPFIQTNVPITTPIQIASREEPLDINTMVVSGTPSIGDKPAVNFVGKKQLALGPNNSLIDCYIYEIGHTPLSLGTDYVIRVSDAKDMAGNLLQTVSFNFKTETTSSGITGSAGSALLADEIAVKDVFGKWISAMNARNATLLTTYMTGDFFWLVDGWTTDDKNRDGRLNLDEFRNMLEASFETYDYCGSIIEGDTSSITIGSATASIVFTLNITPASDKLSDPTCVTEEQTKYADLKYINSGWLINRGSDVLPSSYPPVLDIIELSAPGNGAQYPEPTVSQPLYPNFVWNAVPNVTTYAVLLMEAGSSDTGWVALVDGAAVAAGDPLAFSYTPEAGYTDDGQTKYVLPSGQSFGFTKFLSKMKPGGLYHWAVLGFGTMTKEQIIAGGVDIVADLAASSATNNFSVMNNASPSVIATNPENGDHDVAVDVTITAEFSEDMDPDSITRNGAFILSDEAGNKISCQASYDADTKTASFAAAGLTHEELYTAMVTTNVTDIAGNSVVAYSWLFTTNDNTPPITIATPQGGLYSGTQTVVLQTSEEGATIRYTMDGTDPATSATAVTYTGPIQISSTTTLKFFATDASSNKETVRTETYTIDTTIPTTTATPAAGTYNAAQSVQLACDDAGAMIYYTTNGTPPSAGSPVYTGPIPVTTEGVTVVQFFAESLAGNKESIQSATYTIDLTPPDTTITSMPPDPTTSGTAQFTFASNEASSTFECNLNGAGFSVCESPKRYDVDVISQGTNSFSVRAKDPAGNTDAAPAVYIWRSDSTPPSGTISINAGAQYTTSASVTLTISTTDTVTSVEQMQFSNDGEAWYDPAAYAVSKAWSLPGSDGVKTVYVRFKDAAGNWSTPARDEIILDTTQPDTTITRMPADITSDTEAIFEFTSSEIGATFMCRIDSIDPGAYSPCTSPKSYTVSGSSSGIPHTFSVYAVDLAGNSDLSTPATDDWTVNTSIIVTTATPPGGLYSAVTVTLVSSGTTTNPITTYCTGAGCSPGTLYNAATGIVITDTTILRFSTVDDRGTPEAVKEETYTIDTQDPSIVSLTSSENGTTNSTSVEFKFAASEASSFSCWIDNLAKTPCSSPYSYTNLTSGPHTFQVEPTDTAGNTGTASSFSWTIDLTPPTGTVLINANATYSKSQTVNLSLTSDNAIKMQLSNDGFNWTAEENFVATRNNWTLTYGDGNKTVSVRFKDAAGNWSQSFNDSIILDTIAPNTTITGYPANPSTVSYAYFYFSSTETGSTFMCKVDNGLYSPCTSSYYHYVSSLINGSHSFSVYAIDLATNIDASPASYYWSIDTTGIWDTTGKWDQSTWGQ